MKKITVVGSIAMDFIIETSKVPQEGETVLGENLSYAFGGKGANQAVAASRLGADVKMLGVVGEDAFGKEVIENLASSQVDVSRIGTSTKQATGSAHIILHNHDNRIIVVPGANSEVTPSYLEAERATLLTSDLVILQNEIPIESIEYVINFCDENNIPVLYNPAPAKEISRTVLEKATYLTPNETEFEEMYPGEDLEAALLKHPMQLFVTLGKEGVAYSDGQKVIRVPAYLTQPVDTTGAGDTFNGAFAYALLQKIEIESAVKFGNLASSISIQKLGAQGGIPTMEEMKESEYFEKEWHC